MTEQRVRHKGIDLFGVVLTTQTTAAPYKIIVKVLWENERFAWKEWIDARNLVFIVPAKSRKLS